MHPAVPVVSIQHIAVWRVEWEAREEGGVSQAWRSGAQSRAGPGAQGAGRGRSPGSTAPRMIPRTLEEFRSSRLLWTLKFTWLREETGRQECRPCPLPYPSTA